MRFLDSKSSQLCDNDVGLDQVKGGRLVGAQKCSQPSGVTGIGNNGVQFQPVIFIIFGLAQIKCVNRYRTTHLLQIVKGRREEKKDAHILFPLDLTRHAGCTMRCTGLSASLVENTSFGLAGNVFCYLATVLHVVLTSEQFALLYSNLHTLYQIHVLLDILSV